MLITPRKGTQLPVILILGAEVDFAGYMGTVKKNNWGSRVSQIRELSALIYNWHMSPMSFLPITLWPEQANFKKGAMMDNLSKYLEEEK